MLETVRQYAYDRLADSGEIDDVRLRHFSYFWTEFRSARTILRGAGQVQCLKRLDREQENVRAALDYGLGPSGLPEDGVELAGALFWFWTKRGLFEEGRVWLERATAVGARPELRARASIGLAHMHYFQGHHAAVREHAAAALSAGGEVGDDWAVSVALFLQALTAFELGEHDVAQARAEQARDVAAAGCEVIEQGAPLMVMANVAMVRGDHVRAAKLFNASIDVHRQGGDSWGIATLLLVTTGLYIARGDFAEAHAKTSEALLLYQQLEDPHGVAWSLDVFGGLMAARDSLTCRPSVGRRGLPAAGCGRFSAAWDQMDSRRPHGVGEGFARDRSIRVGVCGRPNAADTAGDRARATGRIWPAWRVEVTSCSVAATANGVARGDAHDPHRAKRVRILCQNCVRYPLKPRSNTAVYGGTPMHIVVAGSR